MSTQRNTIIASVMLLPSFLFAFINITNYNLGVSIFYDVFSPLYPTDGSALASNLTTLVIITGPLLALILALKSLIKVEFAINDAAIVSTIRLNPVVAPLFIVAGSLLVGMIFSIYAFVENFGPI